MIPHEIVLRALKTLLVGVCIILSRASTHTHASTHARASTHPPVLWFFEVLHGTAHYAKTLRSESKGRSTELWLFWCALGAMTSSLHTPVRGLIRSVLPLQHKIHILQATIECCGNMATRLWVSLLCSMLQLLHCRAGLDEAWMKRRCKSIWHPLAANFASGVGPCGGIVEPFKCLLHATAHPQFLAVELQAPMGPCPGQYGMYLRTQYWQWS